MTLERLTELASTDVLYVFRDNHFRQVAVPPTENDERYLLIVPRMNIETKTLSEYIPENSRNLEVVFDKDHVVVANKSYADLPALVTYSARINSDFAKNPDKYVVPHRFKDIPPEHFLEMGGYLS